MERVLTANAGAFVAAVVFGGSVVAVRVVVQTIPPFSLAVLRFGQGASILFVYLVVAARSLLRVERRDVPFLALLGAIFFAIFPITFNAGLTMTEATRGALMLATMPLWSALFAWLGRREELISRQLLGVFLTLSGVAVVLAERGLSLHGPATAIIGDFLLLLTAVSGAVYGVLAKRVLTRYNALTVTAYTMLIGTLLLTPAAIAEGLSRIASTMSETVLALVLFVGILGGALGFFLWTFALTHLTPTQVAVYVNVNPMVATILGATLLSEKLSFLFAVGFIAVSAGVMLVNWPLRKISG